MTPYRRIYADEAGVMPTNIKGQEEHGIIYLTWPDSIGVGGQCHRCNTIVWTNGRINSILTEQRPSSVPSSGDEYKAYHVDKIERFLASLPKCPVCQSHHFDRFINNTSLPRFSDGAEVDMQPNIELDYLDAKAMEIYWLDQ